MFHFSLSLALRQDSRIETKLALAGGYSDLALRGVGSTLRSVSPTLRPVLRAGSGAGFRLVEPTARREAEPEA